MSTQADYTTEEWNLVASGPVLAGMTIVVADPAFFGAMKESAAIAKAIVVSGQSSDVELIQAISAASQGGKKYQTPDIPKDQGTEGAIGVLVEECQKVVQLVREKSADEADEYAQWLVDIARVTAESSKEGGFLGIGATRVSERETAAIQRLADTLGVSLE